MKLAIDCRMYYSAGIGTYLKSLIPLLAEAKPDYEFSLLGDEAGLRSFIPIRTHNISFVDCRGPIYSLAEQMELYRRIPRCDLFFSPHYNIPLLYRGRMITTIHDLFHISDQNEQRTFLRNFYARTMYRSALRKSRYVMADSEFTLREMRRHNLPALDRVRVVHNGVRFAASVSENGYKPEEKKFILFVGNLKPHKNLERLIEAYQLLREKKDFRYPLKIVGKKENFITGIPELIEKIRKSSWNRWIEFTGWVDDDVLTEHYKNAAVLVQPSVYEGFGLTPLEAMAFGCPCAVSSIGALKETCADAAVYFDPYDPADMADKVHRIIADASLRDGIIERGLERIGHFNWNTTARKVLDIIEDALK